MRGGERRGKEVTDSRVQDQRGVLWREGGGKGERGVSEERDKNGREKRWTYFC